ncbi:MAG: tRNA (N(6)-L-threonylcarbamoyladenosine(37)-C(2))-methylthiotransferase MtaB [Candidatus Omnitrophica bacterium]|nr:tRNA (N(6)-L-threonylcarbamoyladenosine(37)-C(2))-methylthiotransferase MtaB [Candidatus Omnitrophota bacterium]
MKTCLFKTIGCKVNQYETQLLRESFSANGYLEVSDEKEAGVCVVNTCTVTKKSDGKSKRVITRIIRKNPQARVIVTGCAVDNEFSAVNKIEGVSLFVRNLNKSKIFSLVNGGNRSRPVDVITAFSNRDKAFVKIEDGCNNFCSYCIVPFTRGRAGSRDAGEIEREVGNLCRAGYKEIILTGINIGFFGRDTGKGLVSLIEGLMSIKSLGRLRLSSIDPQDIDTALINLIKSSDKLCGHLHISVQSADDNVLKLMNRRYDRKLLQNLLERLKREAPNIGLSADFICGFPGEDDNCFKNTLELIEKYDFVKIHIFTYSDREKTAAFKYKDKVAPDTKRKRALLLQEVSAESAVRYKRRFAGKRVEVLVEEMPDKISNLLCGYSDNYIRVLLKNAKNHHKGSIVPAKITGLSGNSVFAEVIAGV